MKWYRVILVLVLATAVAALMGGARSPSPAAQPTLQPEKVAPQPPAKAEGAEAGIKRITAEYQKAFNAGDAKAAARLWTAEGEYVGADGEPISGRPAIEKSLAEYFKAHPKASAEIELTSVRILGRGTAMARGVMKLKVPGEESVIESHYSALHVQEDDGWKTASVREWVPDPAITVTPKDLDWLIGEWSAKGPAGELKITYKWDEDKTFIMGNYEVLKDGKQISRGTQVIGVNPTGGLRSWLFDNSGTTSDALWVRDEKRWVSEAIGVLPDGTEVSSVNVAIRLGPDVFTWQTTDREVDGIPLPALPPVKVTRVKK
jgi:uncharacterized protein (TIGR02246 family)